MNELNTDMMLTLTCAKSSSSSRLFHISSLQYIHSFLFIHLFESGNQAYRNIKQEHKNMHEVRTKYQY